MSDDKPAPKKKGGKLKLIVIGLAAVGLLGGGGVAAGMYVGRAHAKGPMEDPNLPKLVERKDAAEVSTPWNGAGPDPRKYQASYYSFEQNFTSNLKGSDSFVQVGLGVSTFYDKKVLDRLKDDEMPIRSAVLLTLAETDPDSVESGDGKKALQAQLKKAINDVLTAREGFGGVDNVYFTTFVIQ